MPQGIGTSIHNDGKHTGSAKRNGAGGLAPLNDELNLYGINLPPCWDSYSADFVDSNNNIAPSASGNGSYAQSAAPHDLALKSGTGLVGYARFRGRRAYPYASYLMEFGIGFRQQTDGTGDGLYSTIGLCAQTAAAPTAHYAAFICDQLGTWRMVTANASETTQTSLLTTFGRNPTDGDQMTVRIGKTNRDSVVRYAHYYVNGVLVAEHSLYMPEADLQPIVGVWAEDATATVERELLFKSYHFLHMR